MNHHIRMFLLLFVGMASVYAINSQFARTFYDWNSGAKQVVYPHLDTHSLFRDSPRAFVRGGTKVCLETFGPIDSCIYEQDGVVIQTLMACSRGCGSVVFKPTPETIRRYRRIIALHNA